MYRKALLLMVMSVMAFLLLFSAGGTLYAQTDDGVTDPYYEDYDPTLYDDTAFEDYDEIYDDLYDEDYQINVDFPWEVWFLIMGCFGLPMYIFSSLVLYTIGKKVGEPGEWMAWVPILNMYYMVKVAGLSGAMVFLFLVPFVNFFFQIYVYMKIAGRRGFEEWIGLLTLIPVVNFAVMAYLAWGEPKTGVSTPVAETAKTTTTTTEPAKPSDGNGTAV